jgi:hypothetical protein
MAHRVVVSDNNVVTVHVSANELYDKKKLDAIHSLVLSKVVGHPNCCSGFVINYALAEQEVSID